MKLYYLPGACSLSPHIVLREAGVPFELDRIDHATRKTQDGTDFAAVNPKGYVPALRLDDGQILTESSVIGQYVADLKPETGLMPAVGTLERYRVLEWLNFIATELHKTFSPLWKPDTPEASKQAARDLLTKRLGYLNESLAGRSYLTGDAFTVADAYAFTVLGWAGYHKIDLSPLPNVTAFLARVGARPAVREALADEGLA